MLKRELSEILEEYRNEPMPTREALNDILALFSTELLECLPEKRLPRIKITDITYGAEVLYAQGHNDCRQTFLQNLTSKGIIK
jgi:hypothetical protein